MTDLRALLHDAAPEPSRALDMVDIRARAAAPRPRRRLVAWLSGIGVVVGVGVGVPVGGGLLSPAADPHTSVELRPAPTTIVVDVGSENAGTVTTIGSSDGEARGAAGLDSGPASPSARSPERGGSAAPSVTPVEDAPSNTTAPIAAASSSTEYPAQTECWVDNRDLAPRASRTCRFQATERGGASFQSDGTTNATPTSVTGTVTVTRSGRTTTHRVSTGRAQAGELTVFTECDTYIEPGDLVEVTITNGDAPTGSTILGAGEGWQC